MTPIRRRVLVGITAPTLVLIALFTILVILRVRAAGLERLDDELRGRAAALAGLVERDNGTWDMDTIPKDVTDPLVAWQIVDPARGTIIAGHPEAPSPTSASAGGGSAEVRTFSGSFVARHDDDDYRFIGVTASATTAVVDDALAALLRSLLGAGALVASLAVAAGIVLSRRIVDSEDLARLSRAFDQQARFTADASHELRTPLAAVRAQAEVALRKERTPDDYRSVLTSVVESAVRMQRIVESLLVLSRTDEGAVDERARAVVDLVAVARDIVARAERPVSLDVDVAVDDEALRACTVIGDDRLIELAIGNVVGNALKHTTGAVSVAVRRDRTEVIVAVTDTGPGIPADALPRLFDRFFRVDAARSAAGGAGLGLSIVSAVLKQHGGTASVKSELGRGTIVTLRFKAAR